MQFVTKKSSWSTIRELYDIAEEFHIKYWCELGLNNDDNNFVSNGNINRALPDVKLFFD